MYIYIYIYIYTYIHIYIYTHNIHIYMYIEREREREREREGLFGTYQQARKSSKPEHLNPARRPTPRKRTGCAYAIQVTSFGGFRKGSRVRGQHTCPLCAKCSYRGSVYCQDASACLLHQNCSTDQLCCSSHCLTGTRQRGDP